MSGVFFEIYFIKKTSKINDFGGFFGFRESGFD
jgi:hypothetical protein